jgi:hypothetical protein
MSKKIVNDSDFQSNTLCPEEITAVRKMLAERGTSKLTPRDEKVRRPRFKRGNTTQCITIRLSKEMVADARQYALDNQDISKGTINGLIEYLLWRELGSQPDYTIQSE